MRKIISSIYQENQYPGVTVYVIATDDGMMIVDCPLYSEDAVEFIRQVSEFGEPRYIALLDSQHDRVLGARDIDIPLIAQDKTREDMQTWSDTFKGSSNPRGGESDSIRRITGVKSAVPEISFSREMIIQMGSYEVRFMHAHGPTPGAMWVSLPGEKVIFIGDLIHLSEPPFLGKADIDQWIESLTLLRDTYLKDYRIFSSRDGLIDRDDVTSMARFLRKIPLRAERLSKSDDIVRDAENIADELMRDFDILPAQSERMKLRLSAGLIQFTEKLYPIEPVADTD